MNVKRALDHFIPSAMSIFLHSSILTPYWRSIEHAKAKISKKETSLSEQAFSVGTYSS
jgi:hypothetical protein